MRQAKFSLTEQQVNFLEQHRSYGFKDKSEVVRTALQRLQDSLLEEELNRSAQLYAEIHEADSEAQAWVEGAAKDWPE